MARIHDKREAARQSGIFLALTALTLSLFGCLLVLSVTAVKHMSAPAPEAWYTTLLRQGISLLLAIGAAVFVAGIDYHKLVRRSSALLVVIWVGLIAVLIFGSEQYGAKRWINLGVAYLQVSEFAKVVVILCAAHHVTARAAQLGSYTRGFLPALVWMGITGGLVAMEPDFGTTMFLIALSFLLLYLGGCRLSHIVPTLLAGVPAFVWYMMNKFAHVSKRLSSFSEGKQSHVDQALTVMGAGGIFGLGPGEGRAQLDFVNMVRNDFIFAAVGEQFGYLGSILVLLLFLMLFWHGLRITMFARDTAGFLVAFGLTFMIVFQAAINMMVVTGLVPPKGIGLPFVSHGGSSILMLGCAIGILLNVSRQGGEPLPAPESDRAAADDEDELLASTALLDSGSWTPPQTQTGQTMGMNT